MSNRSPHQKCARAVQKSLDNVSYVTCLHWVQENWRRFDAPISEKKKLMIALAKEELEPELED